MINSGWVNKLVDLRKKRATLHGCLGTEQSTRHARVAKQPLGSDYIRVVCFVSVSLSGRHRGTPWNLGRCSKLSSGGSPAFLALTSRKAARPKRKKPQKVTGERLACRRIQPERNRHNASRRLEPQTTRRADVNNRAIEVSTSRTRFYTAVKQYGDRYWFTYRMAQSKARTGTRSTRLACFHKDCRFNRSSSTVNNLRVWRHLRQDLNPVPRDHRLRGRRPGDEEPGNSTPLSHRPYRRLHACETLLILDWPWSPASGTGSYAISGSKLRQQRLGNELTLLSSGGDYNRHFKCPVVEETSPPRSDSSVAQVCGDSEPCLLLFLAGIRVAKSLKRPPDWNVPRTFSSWAIKCPRCIAKKLKTHCVASRSPAHCKSLELPKLPHLTGSEIGYTIWESGLE